MDQQFCSCTNWGILHITNMTNISFIYKKLIQINKKNQMEKWAKEVNILFMEERPKG